MSGVDVCVFIWLKKVMWSRSGKEGVWVWVEKGGVGGGGWGRGRLLGVRGN